MDVMAESPDTAIGGDKSPPPDWAMVPFAVACARCGQDLRGRSEPVCPKCGLQFDWAEAVPIEQLICAQCGYHLYGLTEMRCPECGRPFTWAGALAEYHRRQHFLFEYRWRDRPFRSLVATWFHALRPRRFWKRISLHDPPNVRALVAMVVILLAAFFMAMPVSMGATTWGTAQLQSRGRPVTGLGWWIARMLCIDEPYIWLGATATWCLASLGALLVFRQSMRRYQVRVPHVVRAWACSVPLVPMLIPPVLGALMVWSDGVGRWWALPWPWLERLSYLLLGLVVIHAGWCVSRAYKHYLRMRHALAVAVAAQIMAVLAALAVVACFTPRWIDGFLSSLLGVLFGHG
jgi:hypothetical protein